ncbi:MAG: protein kinase [Planctomycetota bacterium]|nr:protein kinase [Planctomycetota bacterium]MDA1159514.1 protein kinase [Planctomycetota bacterium]
MSDLLNQSEPVYQLPDYEFLRPIGRGRFAYVYLATQRSLNRPVAVKVLSNADDEFLTRFEREAEIMANVSHPNIVSVIDRGVIDSQHFIVMEFMDGGSLRDRMLSDHSMKLTQVRSVISALASALTCLHGMGLIHRDVKPDNVLFDRNGQIKLCDFGIAAPLGQVGQLTDVNASPGTVDYMAPEQRHRLGVSREADQFALAVMAYELLTGNLPSQVFRQVSAKNPQLDHRIDRVLEQALQEQPEARFPSVKAFADALDDALSRSVPDVDKSKAAAMNRKALSLSVLAVALCVALVYWQAPWEAGVAVPQETGVSGESLEPGQVASASEVPASAELIQQTGVLTYRIDSSGRIEVLIVTARSGGHWTIPKANQAKEKTLANVAEDEAFEEAGVRGVATPVVIGSYGYERGDRSYQVSVVPMRFTEELIEWPGSTRERRWGTTKEISAMVASDKLRQIIESFSPNAVETSDLIPARSTSE